MTIAALAFLLDVDNTLLANDDVKEDIDAHIRVEMGPELTERYWEYYEEARQKSGVVDIPLALRLLRERTPLAELDEQTYRHVVSLFDNYPFIRALYPHVIETIRYLSTLGLPIIVSDGDCIFQAEKIFASSLAELVDGRVLIYDHKQQHLQEIMQTYPANHYVMVDDKPQILVDCKALMGEKLTTVFVRQGKYAARLPPHFTSDITLEHFGDLGEISAAQFLKVQP